MYELAYSPVWENSFSVLLFQASFRPPSRVASSVEASQNDSAGYSISIIGMRPDSPAAPLFYDLPQQETYVKDQSDPPKQSLFPQSPDVILSTGQTITVISP